MACISFLKDVLWSDSKFIYIYIYIKSITYTNEEWQTYSMYARDGVLTVKKIWMKQESNVNILIIS